jgi:predicted metal-binding protein
VDEHFNCEDIVFNFMVANITGLPSIKVTPRKRFKCPECTNTGLYVDPSHFLKRDECFNLFAKYFKGVSLKTTYYRLDPVLYKVNSIPDKQKVFPNIGTL